jgi:nucleosome-remodeling factor subunit BPTF
VLLLAGSEYHDGSLYDDKRCEMIRDLRHKRTAQASEERDRKRYLSHKFSITGCGEFKWSGSTFGNRTVMLQTVRSTLLQLHSQLPAIFMHPNWAGSMRKSWIQAVNQSVSPTDLGRVLSILVACIRPVVFSIVWHESLGHIRLQRQTALEREERKKVDKKEKKDKELEEEMHRLHTVHYTKGLKHQVNRKYLFPY